MKKSTLIIVLALSWQFSLSQITFEKVYGGEHKDRSRFVQQTNDNGYIIAGYTGSFIPYWELYIIKTNETGDTMWTKTVGEEDAGYYGNCIQQTNDNGYIISGYFQLSGPGNGIQDAFLLKTNENGDTLWMKSYGGEGEERANSVHQTDDNGYIIAGQIYDYDIEDGNMLLIKTDENGVTLWTKTFGGENWQSCRSMQQTNENGYILAGITSITSENLDIYLIKTDENGDTMWSKTIGGEDWDIASCVQQTNDGGYVISGGTKSYSAGDYDGYLLKIDENGNTLWMQIYGGDGEDYCNYVQQTPDGGYIITGNSTSFSGGIADVYLIKTDENGDTLWTKTIGGEGGDYSSCIQLTNDGGYVLSGSTDSYGAGELDIYLIKTDENGLITSINNKSHISSIKTEISPNPFINFTTISYVLNNVEFVKIEIYDFVGRKLESLVNDFQIPGEHQLIWNAENSPPGIYFCKIRIGKSMETKKMILSE